MRSIWMSMLVAMSMLGPGCGGVEDDELLRVEQGQRCKFEGVWRLKGADRYLEFIVESDGLLKRVRLGEIYKPRSYNVPFRWDHRKRGRMGEQLEIRCFQPDATRQAAYDLFFYDSCNRVRLKGYPSDQLCFDLGGEYVRQ